MAKGVVAVTAVGTTAVAPATALVVGVSPNIAVPRAGMSPTKD